MKKILSLGLALASVFAMSTNAMALDEDDDDDLLEINEVEVAETEIDFIRQSGRTCIYDLHFSSLDDGNVVSCRIAERLRPGNQTCTQQNDEDVETTISSRVNCVMFDEDEEEIEIAECFLGEDEDNEDDDGERFEGLCVDVDDLERVTELED